MGDIKRLREDLREYIRNIKQARTEENKVSYYRELIKTIFSEIPPNGLIPFTGRPIRVYDKNGKSSIKEADLLWDNVLIEFESNLSSTKIKECERQLREYVSGCLTKDRSKQYHLFGSDCITFRKYRYDYPQDKDIITPDDVSLKPASQINFESSTIDGKRINCEQLLRTIRSELTPLRLNFVQAEQAHELFVSKSDLYDKCMRILKMTKQSDHAIQFDEWLKYQNLVYGSFTKADSTKNRQHEIFLDHTYMATVAKVLAYATIHPDDIYTMDKKAIISGKAFKDAKISNFITEDFFSWIDKKGTVWDEMIDLIFAELEKFDIRNIDRDILRSIYETIEEPKKRHQLGAVYTPEWLAEMILNELFEQHRKAKKPGIPSVLDPACGSGTFLALAVRKIRNEYGPDSDSLLKSILKSVVGFDLHPVAVLFSKTNYLIALKDLIAKRRGAISIPVYMADTIDFPKPESASAQIDTAYYGNINLYKYSTGGDQKLILPEEVIESSDLDMVIDAIQDCAKRISKDRSKIEIYLEGLKKDLARYNIKSAYQIVICDTAKTLACLIEQDKDTIHAFIFKNIYKPALVDDFDIIAGNPPWVVYRNISDEGRQDRLKKSTSDYGLLADQSTFQAMELATLFFVWCVDKFLKEGGVIGFVMPRSILQANQHYKFRIWEQNGKIPIQYSMIYDMGNPMKVKELFTITSCVLFGKKRKARRNNGITSYQFEGKIKKNSTLADIESLIKKKKFHKKKTMMYLHRHPKLNTITTVKDLFLRESVYKKDVIQGATIFPHSLWRVKRVVSDMGTSEDYPMLETVIGPKAKKPWDDIKIKRVISKRYLFSTIYGISIMPFYFTESNLVVVPAVARKGSYKMMTSDDLVAAGDSDMADWVDEAQGYWTDRKKAKGPDSILDWVDYRRKITRQNPGQDAVLLYNKSGGEYIRSCLVDVPDLKNKEKTSGFIVESSTYYYYPETVEEGKYLCTVLNSRYLAECISAIKSALDVHKTPWEFSIPRFDPDNGDHKDLVKLYDECHAKLKNNRGTRVSTDHKQISDKMPTIDKLAKKTIMEEYYRLPIKKNSDLRDESD